VAGGFELEFGGLETFFGGLEAVVGTPSPRVREEMEAEHCRREDSELEFSVDHYKITTTSRVEWLFVASPDGAETWGGQWPAERTELPPNAAPRQPLPLSAFDGEMEARNGQLRALRQPELLVDELLAARLYTGPVFAKYNGVLRGLQSKVPIFRERFEALCMGNRYTTTLHAIASAVVKLSQLTVARHVYRGVSGGKLPAALRRRSTHGVRGGVDLAFMSTTEDRAVALHYAGSRGGPAVALELQQGLVSRGADVSWLSQYPHEKEARCLDST
jgi:hypothetical protein